LRETLSVLTFKDNIDYYNWVGFANQESKTLHGPYVGAETDHTHGKGLRTGSGSNNDVA
jgi:putative methionine-R-sulfoxide reductase with GAF domain